VVKNIFFALAVILLVLFCILPFIQMLSVSFKYSWEWGNPSLLPKMINWEAYGELINPNRQVREPYPIMKILIKEADLSPLQEARILNKYKNASEIFPFSLFFVNSLFLSLTAALWSTFLALLGAFSLGRLQYRGKYQISRLIILVYLLGGVLMLIPLYKICGALGLLKTAEGTIFGLIFIYLIQVLPVALYLLGNYFRAIPVSLDDAGLIDGLTQWGTLFRIIIPLSRSALFTVFIYCFIIVWNDYLYASVFLKSYPQFHTLPLGIRFLFLSKNAVWDRIMAASILTALPVVMLFWAIQNNLEQGFTEGLKE
jgi:multiple sugar transport system permease protein